MTHSNFHIQQSNTEDAAACLLQLTGDWQLGQTPDGATLCAEIPASVVTVRLLADELGKWDSSLAIALTQVARHCENNNINLETDLLPEGLQQLLTLASGVPAFQSESEVHGGFGEQLKAILQTQWQSFYETLVFVGDTGLALERWFTGKAKTRKQDIAFYLVQTGPQALAIVTLIAVLVGMILAYLGSVQLRQLGAQVYVANLVGLGMVREMGPLMTAVIMAGRTGAAYAAQLGTMQVNEEIDALKTMGVSSMEFLVVPRVLALVMVMPLLVIYANVVGMVGGAMVATTMDVSISQYILQIQKSVDWLHISTGLIKSVFFGLLIAIAGCQAGLSCGRNSDAVGMAATHAVVRAIVYLVVADAAFNILYFKLGI